MQFEVGRARIQLDAALGGRLSSLCIDGREILVTQSDDPRGWGCYPMVPWAGRVRSGQFSWKNRLVQLPVNCGPHSIHGTVLERPWRVEAPGVLSCSLGSDWPWAGTIRSEFVLSSAQLVWTMTVMAKAEPFPVVLGWHPWFRRTLSPGADLRYSLEAAEMYVRDDAGIPSGEIKAPATGPWDDCFRELHANPILQWSDGFEIEMSSTCDHWVLYDEPDHAVCIEPQSGPPDGFNLGCFEVAMPGAPVQHSMTLRWV